MAVFDPATLNQLTAATFTGTGYRNQTPGFDPRSGEGARRFGGRFNPPRSFPVIYICLTRLCTVAELAKQAERQGIAIADLLPRELWSLRTELDGVLDLSDGQNLRAAGLTAADLTLPDHAFTQQIGEAAHERGYQAIRSPSATGVDEILGILPANLGGAAIDVELLARWETVADVT